MSDLTESLARGLFKLDRHKWALGEESDDTWESVRLHYRRDVERFLLPELEDGVA